MKIPLQIVFKDIPRSDAVEAEIQKRAAKLDQIFERLMSCRVAVGSASRHKHQGKLYKVHIDMTVPGAELVINGRHEHEDIYVAIRDAFDAAGRRLEDHARRQRGEVKLHPDEWRGKVVRLFEEGYGFIATPGGRELYFSRDNVVTPTFDDLSVGTEVQFIEEMGSEGPQAKRVTAGKHHAP
ncbi:MAG: HPF/RaiA family ribosome-associated protein [Burkholderiales bacterium]